MEHLDIIGIVEGLLDFSETTKPPVILSRVVKYWNDLKVTLEDIEGEAFLVDLGSVGTNILIKSKANRGRQRFSLAHEIGHLILKENGILISQSSLKSRNLEIERWCNEFASELLMPSAWIKTDVLGQKVSSLFALSYKLAEKYQVSFEAMLIRLTEVTQINIVRFNIKNQNIEIKFNKSKIEPIKIEKYKHIIIDKIKCSQSNNAFFVDNDIYCHIQVQRKKGTNQNWISYLARVSESLTISSSGRKKPRR